MQGGVACRWLLGAAVGAVAPCVALARVPSEPTSAGPAQEAAHASGAGPARAGHASLTEADRRYHVAATRAPRPPRIDGRLDEEAWADAPALTGFVQSQPDEGAPATERTEVRVLFDGAALYVGALLYDSEPERIVASVLRRDEPHEANDAFAVTLDTYHDHRNGYLFETNALGAKFDAQIIGEGGSSRFGSGQTFNADWDAVWDAAAARTDEGWSVEMRIPFWSLRFDRSRLQIWGINFRRTIRRRAEQAYWAPVPRQFNATRLSLSGMLSGLDGLARPRNLQVKPFVRGDLGQFPDGPTGDPLAHHKLEPEGDLGLDVKWTVTPNVTIDATANTDFAQVEADDVQINLTRFPLFFPEKREFFLENAGLFQFGSGGRARGNTPRVLGFHSRRIGIAAGREVPIIAGVRATGKSGPWSFGVLDMQTAAVGDVDLPSRNHGVLRVRRELGRRSNVGLLFASQEGGGANRQLGFDGRWALDEHTTVDAWWMKTWTRGLYGESDWAGAVQAQWATSSWQLDAAAMQVGDAFDPGLGFVNRRDIRAYNSTAMWTPYFRRLSWLRNLSPHVSLQYVTDRRNVLLSRRWHFDYDMFLRRGDKLSLAHNRRFERLDRPFEIVPGVIVPAGVYRFDELNLELQSDPSRALRASLNYTWGGFWDGTRREWRVEAGVRAGARLDVTLSLDRNDVELPGGDFVTELWRLRVAYDFNTRLSLSGLFQYDNLTDQLQTNLRLNYIQSPGSDVFLVYNERRATDDPTLIDRALILKVTQLLRF